jgi:hypothetical protein
VRARSAFCDVTPRGRPVQLAGYAGRPPATQVRDAIEISAVLLEDGERRCLIFSFDLMGVGAQLQAMILTRLSRHGFKPGEVMCLASHTHFAPATDRACAPLGEPDDRFVSDAAEAAENLVRQILRAEPVETRLEIKQGALDHSINRRRYWPLPTFNRTYGLRLSCIAMAPEPDGATDERATVILLRRADSNAVMVAIWHYACHATAVVPSNAISADFPGAVRRALRQEFGDVPCLFVQGFCGDISPKMVRALSPLSDRLRSLTRLPIQGPTFPPSTPDDYVRWSESLAAAVVRIAQSRANEQPATGTLATGLADVALSSFFEGKTPDKPLLAHIVRLGAIELMTLSAEVTMEWQPILENKIPPRDGRLRLYAGYLGTLYGYLPTPDQIREGGYEVTGFQHLFGLSGRFDAEKIVPAVVDCVKRAVDDLERAPQG